MLQRSLPTPLGRVIAFAKTGELYGAYFDDAIDLPDDAPQTGHANQVPEGDSARGAVADAEAEADARLLDLVEAEFAAYFAGTLTHFSLPLAKRGTPFQQAVWTALAAVPFGTTLSYGDLAARAGRPCALRAVGNSVGRNPWIIVVPCHRVLAARLALGGFSSGLDRKRALLRHEGLGWRE